MSHDRGAILTRSPVVFKYIEDSYPTDGVINFTIVCEDELRPDDYIALHTVGSYDENSPIFKLTYRELRVHHDSHVAAAVIPVSSFATSLPDDGYYQLCYYSNGKLIDASTPIQIRRARAEDLLEAPTPGSPEEDEFVVIKSDKALLQDRINTLTRTNEELESETFTLKNYVGKLEKDLNEMTRIKVNQDAIISELDDKNEALNQAVSSLNLELHGRVKELDTMSASLEKYRALSREKADEFNEISKCKNLIQQEHQERVRQIEEMKHQKEHLSALLEQTREHLADQSQLIQDGLVVQSEMKKEIEDLTRKNADLTESLRSSQGQVEKLQIASKFVEIRYDDNQRQVDQLTKLNKQLQLDLAKATDDLNKVKARHDKLKVCVSVSLLKLCLVNFVSLELIGLSCLLYFRLTLRRRKLNLYS